MTSPDTINRSLVNILKETFEGPQQEWSHYVENEPEGGLLATLDALSPERASTTAAPGRSTVAAHTGHLRFIVAGINAGMRGEQPSGDWGSSWAVTTVDEDAWKRLRDDLCHAYAKLMESVRQTPEWSEEWLSGAFGLVAHVAYHFGAIRQIVRLV